jgi:hypothetical protein
MSFQFSVVQRSRTALSAVQRSREKGECDE